MINHFALTSLSLETSQPSLSPLTAINIHLGRIKKILQYAVSFLLLPFASEAQSTLSGVVKDEKDKSALAFVSLALKTAHDSVFVSGTITDGTGRFSLMQIPAGDYVLDSPTLVIKRIPKI